MSQRLLACVFALCAGQASAQSCPDFFRFVDFGVQAAQGVFQRGGPMFRAESLAGRPLLNREQTLCRDVAFIGADGHANPIPVVESIQYDVAKTDLDLTRLQVRFTENAGDLAGQNAATHRDRLLSSSHRQFKSEASLCVVTQAGDMISCQLYSPYPAAGGLVIYCDARQCEMPVLAANQTVYVAVSWEVDAAFVQNPDTAGQAIVNKVQGIHAFLAPLVSGL